MSAIIAATRDAIATAITAAMAGGSPALTPLLPVTPIYDIYFNLEDLDGGQCLVVPQKKDSEPFTRQAATKRVVDIDVAIQFKYGTTGPTPAVLDPYMGLAEDLADYFERTTISTGAVVTRVSHPQIFVDEQLRKARTFTSVVTISCLLLSL